MSLDIVHAQVRTALDQHLPRWLSASSRERLALLVSGMIEARSSRPARIAAAICNRGWSAAEPESVERRIRRTQNDPELQAHVCVDPLVRQQLHASQARALVLVLDPTCQDDRIVLVMASVWYRGRALPLAWTSWPANQPLTGAGFWERIRGLLAHVARLLPAGVTVTWLADRAFGTPQFTDAVAAYGWHWVVRVQDQTRYRDRTGRERRLRDLVRGRGQRAKGRGEVFKKQGWRTGYVLAFWGRRHPAPLLLASDQPIGWDRVACYRQRSGIEGSFRDYKTDGWELERSQVTDLAHVERLLIGLALASWLVTWVGAQRAAEYLRRPATGRRRTRPYAAKYSLFALGLHGFARYLARGSLHAWQLTDWQAPNWSFQITQHHLAAYIWALH
jgi:hypothetical protein